MGNVPSRSTGKEDGNGHAEQAPGLGTMEATRRQLSDMPPANNERNWLAQPPYCTQGNRWKQRNREPRPCTPQLPQPGSCQTEICVETVSRIKVLTKHQGALLHA